MRRRRVCETIIGGKKKSRVDELERKNKDMGVWKVVDFGICFDRRSSNVQQKGGQGLVGILLRTLTNISLDILVSHGLDITHHLHQAVRVYFVFVFIHNSIIMPFKHIMFLNSSQFLHISSFLNLKKNAHHIIPYQKLHILSRHEVDTNAKVI